MRVARAVRWAGVKPVGLLSRSSVSTESKAPEAGCFRLMVQGLRLRGGDVARAAGKRQREEQEQGSESEA